MPKTSREKLRIIGVLFSSVIEKLAENDFGTWAPYTVAVMDFV